MNKVTAYNKKLFFVRGTVIYQKAQILKSYLQQHRSQANLDVLKALIPSSPKPKGIDFSKSHEQPWIIIEPHDNTPVNPNDILPLAWGTLKETLGPLTNPSSQSKAHTHLVSLEKLIIDEYQVFHSYLHGCGGFLIHSQITDVPAMQYLLEVGREIGIEGGIIVLATSDLDMVGRTDAVFLVIDAEYPLSRDFMNKLKKLDRINFLWIRGRCLMEDLSMFSGFIMKQASFEHIFKLKDGHNVTS